MVTSSDQVQPGFVDQNRSLHTGVAYHRNPGFVRTCNDGRTPNSGGLSAVVLMTVDHDLDDLIDVISDVDQIEIVGFDIAIAGNFE